jgi:hypothetical protein
MHPSAGYGAAWHSLSLLSVSVGAVVLTEPLKARVLRVADGSVGKFIPLRAAPRLALLGAPRAATAETISRLLQQNWQTGSRP